VQTSAAFNSVTLRKVSQDPSQQAKGNSGATASAKTSPFPVTLRKAEQSPISEAERRRVRSLSLFGSLICVSPST
jgi:hypothetical protein